MGKADRSREYQPGDRVRRKIDGQPMTAEEVYTPFYVYRFKCSWGPDPQTKSGLFRVEGIEPDQTE